MHERITRDYPPREAGVSVLVLSVVVVGSVALRMASKRITTSSIRVDDYLILVATPLMLGSVALTVYAEVKGALGRHVNSVDLDRVELSLKSLFVIILLYPVVVAFVKSSTLLLYSHLFGVRREFRMQICVALVIVWGWAVGVALSTLFICTPMEFNWNPTLPAGRCGHQNAFYIAGGIANTMTDVLIMAMPIPHIWGLQMPVSQRVAVSSVFALGTLVFIIGVIRIPAIVRIDYGDITFTLRWPLLWTIIEEQLAIICANLLLARPVLTRLGAARLPHLRKRTPDAGDGRMYDAWALENSPTVRTQIAAQAPRLSISGFSMTTDRIDSEARARIHVDTEIA
ncbi:hypothetical protein ZTR_09886, partial [Talaromyces verruculosus]